jgi:hypothetical protein
MSGRTLGGSALLVIAALMLLGFMRSDASIAAPAAIGALLITVALPAAAGIALLGGFATLGGRRSARVEHLRQQTIDAEILRLAMQQGGRLTAIEVATALVLTPESAKSYLDAFVSRDVADLEITDRGLIVYTFHDAKHVGGKSSARGLLDA